MRILSLGAGVQSSCIALMSEKGFIEKIDCAIFADTMNEPKSVYVWLEKLKGMVSFPVYVVSKGDLMLEATTIRNSKKNIGKQYVRPLLPAFLLQPDGKKGLMGRRCTGEFKIVPVHRKIKELLGIKRATKNNTKKADLLIGISTDEAHRIKSSQVNYADNVYPLIDLNMTRTQCLKWLSSNGYPEPPRSSCSACPFHGDKEWKRLKDSEPDDFAKAIEIEKKLQEAVNGKGLSGVPYLHGSCKPLGTIDFSSKKGYQQLDLFGNECEGLCGV